MDKKILLEKLISEYNRLSFTHEYIFGFEEKGLIFGIFANAEILPYICYIDKGSEQGGYSLRYRPNKEQKSLLKTYKNFVLCSKEFFENEYKNSKYNRGEIFEKLVTEKFGQIWAKDNIPFTKAGDIQINGIDYQIKFTKATFINEKILKSLG
jgi:hypothetical protein